MHPIRLDGYTQSMLRLFEALLGRHFWDFVVIVFTHVDEENVDTLEEHMDAVVDPAGKSKKKKGDPQGSDAYSVL